MKDVRQLAVGPLDETPIPPGPVPQLAVVIPTLHEAKNIKAVLERIRGSLDPLDINYELIVIDDDSRDGTESIVKHVAQQDTRVRLLLRQNQRGLAGAIAHGWRHSQAEVLGVIDADLQHPPEVLPELWKTMQAGHDLVIASRYAAPGGMREWNLIRRLLSKISTRLAWPFQRPGIRVKDPLSGFFLVRRSSLDGISLQPEGFKILLEILVKGRIRSVAEVPFVFGLRQAGSSKADLSTGWHYLRLLERLWREP
ncbi:MAG TPA: polyprenol monophosphomannose synthase [Terriglobales bacterium]|nr:polyprenol monophosphomannose synthase [Terriglobales bacterium]